MPWLHLQFHGEEESVNCCTGTFCWYIRRRIISEVIEVHDFEELKILGRKKIEGKIVFFNRPADNKLINSFSGYGGAVNQRTQGASEASKYGAVAVIVRSATQSLDDFPHTGVTHYEDRC